MSAILFFDVETSGLWRAALAHDHPSQPHLVQLTAKLVRIADRKKMGGSSWLIQPEGWSIEPEAEEVHHISLDDCRAYGLPISRVLLELEAATRAASLLVAHNAQFDRATVWAAISRTGTGTQWWDRLARSFRCTMEETTDIVRLPGQFGGFKFPTLSEAHDHFVPALAPYLTLHQGEADTDACERIWWALQDHKESDHGNTYQATGHGFNSLDGAEATAHRGQ